MEHSILMASRTTGVSSLRKVAVIDDEPYARASYADYLEDLGLEPVDQPGPLGTLEQFIKSSLERSDAAICDHRIRMGDYAEFTGAQLVSEYYRKGFPALLYTSFEDDIDEIRTYRKHIPILLTWEDLMDPDIIQFSFERIVAELHGKIPPSRRPWRTLVRVHDVDHDRGLVRIFLPGWNPYKGLRLRLKDIPSAVLPRVHDGARLHAHVNIGAEKHGDLFFERWEID